MACLSPILMVKYDFTHFPPGSFLARSHYWKEHGYLVDKENQFLYKIVNKASRKLPLEKILDEYNLPGSHSEILEIPCRQCLGCRLDYSKDWANRCSLEAKKYEHNYFITLTYDEDHVVKGEIGNDTLSKEDFDKFVHSLRDYFRLNFKHLGIKVFGCGEYGDITWRPHYHILCFNLPLFDLTESFPSEIPGSYVHKLDALGVPMKFSPLIEKLWNKGIHTIQEFSWNAGAYVSKYILKKQIGESSVIYQKLGVIPPFLRMSQGIGKDYLLKNKQSLLDNPCLIVGRDHKAPLVSGLPHYFKKVLKAEFPEEYESIIEASRSFMENQRSCIRDKQLINTNRERKEEKIIANTSLPRDLGK